MNNLKPYDFMILVDIPRSKRQRSYLYRTRSSQSGSSNVLKKIWTEKKDYELLIIPKFFLAGRAFLSLGSLKTITLKGQSDKH